MPPRAECKYYSFEKRDGNLDCDKVISVVATTITIGCIIGYFIYTALR